MTQTSLDFDTSRGRDNQHSQAAFAKLKPRIALQRREVYLHVSRAGKAGITCEQVAEKMNRYPNQISGRFPELVKDGLIRVKSNDGLTRLGNSCKLYVE